MARRQVLVSDYKGGRLIEDEKQAARIRVTYMDQRKSDLEADVAVDEVEEILRDLKPRSVARRGRRPKAAPAAA